MTSVGRSERGRTPNLCLLLLAALVIAVIPTFGSAQTSGPPVLLITVDTLRADHLGCYGDARVHTPAIDGLAAHGVRFENAFSQVPITFPSHTVILSGTYPMWNGVRDFTSKPLDPSVGLIAEAFRRHGYRTAAFVSAFVLDRTWGLSRGFETYDDQFDPRQFETRNPGNIERRAGETVPRVLAWLEKWRATSSAGPFFIWLHLYDPHSPYDPPEPFHSQYAGHLYDGEIAYADSQLGRLFEAMKKDGVYDRTLIVLLSDHGESLGEHGEAEHGFFIYRSTLHVPLILKPPGSEPPRVVPSPVGTIDVAPTLLDLAGIQDPLARQFQGMSLASIMAGKSAPRERSIYAETYYPHDSFGWSELRGIYRAQYHYIEAPKREFYDWKADPGEMRNLAPRQQALAATYRDDLLGIERRYARAAPQGGQGGPPLSAETLEKLRSLGYLAYSAPAATVASGQLPDPKDRLRVFNDILSAEDLSSLGRLGEANTLLKKIALEEPKLYLVPFMLGENAAKARDWPEAQRQFLACLKVNPNFDQAIMGAARSYMGEGRFGDARPWLELAIHQNPHNFQAYFALGVVVSREGNLPQARQDLTRSLQEKPDFAPALIELGSLLVASRDYQEALEPLTRAQALSPGDFMVENFLGTCYANTGRLPQAIEAYQKSLKLKPDYPPARLNLAFALLKQGDRAKASEEFRTVCRQDARLCEQYRRAFE